MHALGLRPTNPSDPYLVCHFANHDAGVTIGNPYLGFDTLTEPLYVVGQWYSDVNAYHPTGASALGNTDPSHVRHEWLYNFLGLIRAMGTADTPGYSSSDPEMLMFDHIKADTPTQATNPADTDPYNGHAAAKLPAHPANAQPQHDHHCAPLH